MPLVYRNEIVFSVLVDPHCSCTSRLCVTPSTERTTCAGPSKPSASSSKRKSGPSCETCNFEPSRTTRIFTSAEWPVRLLTEAERRAVYDKLCELAQGDQRWEEIINDERLRPKLESFLEKARA